MEDFAEKHRNVGYSNAVSFEMRQMAGLLSPLVGSVTNYSGQASQRIENRFDELQMEESDERNGDTNITDIDSLVRFIKVGKPRDVAVLLDRNDQKVTQVQFGDPIAKQIAKAAHRVHDDEWLKGYFGNGWAGETGDVAVPFDPDNVIDDNGEGLTLDKLIELQLKMGLNDVDIEEGADGDMPIVLITPYQRADLLRIPEYKNADFNDKRPLVRGEVKPFMGFRFIQFNPDSAKAYPQGGKLTKTGQVRSLPAFKKEGLHRGVWTEFFGDIGPRRDKKINTQIYGEARSAVVRTNEDCCYLLECQEPA